MAKRVFKQNVLGIESALVEVDCDGLGSSDKKLIPCPCKNKCDGKIVCTLAEEIELAFKRVYNDSHHFTYTSIVGVEGEDDHKVHTYEVSPRNIVQRTIGGLSTRCI